MAKKRKDQDLVFKIVIIGVLTALSVGLSMIKLPITGVSVTLLLPVVIIGAALYGPWVGAWLTVIPNIIAYFTEGALFMMYSPIGGFATIVLKGILAGIAAGFIYKALSKKHPIVAVTLASIAAPLINTGVFVFGSYVLVWDKMIDAALEAGVAHEFASIAILLGLGFNMVVELILNVALCPGIFRILQIVTKKKLA